MQAILKRFTYSTMGTIGVLAINDFECYTLELPWQDNKPNKSCIPAGVYPVTLGNYWRGGYPAYELSGVPYRTEIKIHIGNTAKDVLGCIVVGNKLGFIKQQLAVLNSKNTLDDFMKEMHENRITEIKVIDTLVNTMVY